VDAYVRGSVVLTDPEKAVRSQAPHIASALKEAGERARNEAELRTAITRLVGDFAEQLDLHLDLREEYTLINGRADAVYNRFVVEYEPPASLRDSNRYQSNQRALGQVKQYLEELSQVERQRLKRLAGVATDGHYYIFVRFREGHWRVDDAVPVTASSTEKFLRYLTSLSTELALTPENLLRDFGGGTAVAAVCVGTLYHALSKTELPKVQTLFEQWQLQFSEVCGWERQSSRLDIPTLASNFGVEVEEPDPLRLFFCIHTYYATFIKLLAVQIASYYAFPMLGTGLYQVASYASDNLRAYLEKMERGGVFADFGVSNFLEGDFFGWYLDLWGEEIDQAIRQVITQLALYSLVTLDVDPEETRDLLKKLYQNLMPRKLRHALGEYYTPDWLAERLLNQLCGAPKKGVLPTIDPAKRLLDPACGSGTFLVLAIRRMRNWAEERMMPEHEALEKILANVVGFDLNPLAVISARTNYLLSLGDLIQHRRGEISIPVYLADSIMTPSTGQTLFEQDRYTFSTAVGKFSVPRVLVEAQSIDRLASLLEESVDVELTAEQFERRASEAFPSVQQDEGQLAVTRVLYERLRELDEQGINGIWARVIKNAFAPLFQGRFDYVMGNPPWVNWESLPEEYREETADLWAEYGMAATKGKGSGQFELGKQKRDISTLMAYVALDKYVKDGGRLGFLITQTVFKTGGAEGFRRFQLPDGTPLRVIHVDDMSQLKPFAGAANRTAAMVLERNRDNRYPVPYASWRGRGRTVGIREDLTLEEATQITRRANFVARPVDTIDLTSPWLTGRTQAVEALHRLLGPSHYGARAGVCTWFNAIYWVEVVAQRPDGLLVVHNVTNGAKRKVEPVQVPLEPGLLYPLLRGGDVNRWQARVSATIILPHTPETSWQALPEEELRLRYPRTYAYLARFREELLSRSGYQLLRKGHPFYILGDVHTHTFAPLKVVWPRIAAEINAAVSGVSSESTDQKPVVPQETISFVPADQPEEAHYLCAVLNSSPFNFAAQSYSQRGGKSLGSPHLLENLRVPRFEQGNSVHLRLASLSQEAHEATTAGDQARVKEIEEEIDQLAAELWGLTPQELLDIKRSLEELR
jgi:SAM-dependent methyltransferase